MACFVLTEETCTTKLAYLHDSMPFKCATPFDDDFIVILYLTA